MKAKIEITFSFKTLPERKTSVYGIIAWKWKMPIRLEKVNSKFHLHWFKRKKLSFSLLSGHNTILGYWINMGFYIFRHYWLLFLLHYFPSKKKGKCFGSYGFLSEGLVQVLLKFSFIDFKTSFHKNNYTFWNFLNLTQPSFENVTEVGCADSSAWANDRSFC